MILAVNAANRLIEVVEPRTKILVLTFFAYLALC